MLPKQRNSTWRKRYLLGSDKIKERFIGKPVLVETTLHEDFIENLPDVRDIHAADTPKIRCYGPSSAVDDEKYMKELPPLSFQLNEEQYRAPRPVSEVPTASSIYTKPSPRLSSISSEFDPEYQVAPLFAGRNMPSDRSRSEGSTPALQGSESDSTLRPPFAERSRNAGMGALGIDTSFGRPLWQGASGQTNQLTPITATPAGTATADSVSPVEDTEKDDYFPHRSRDEHHTPEPASQNINDTPSTQVPRSAPNTTPPSRNDFIDQNTIHQQTPPVVSRFSWTTHANSTPGPKTLPPSTPDTQSSVGSWANSSPPNYYKRARQYQQSPTPASYRQYGTRASPYSASGSPARLPPTPEASPPQTRDQPPRTTIDTSSPITALEAAPTPPSPIMSRRRPLSNLPKTISQPPQPHTKSPCPPAAANALMRIKRKPTPSSIATSVYGGPAGAPLSPTSPDRAGDKQKSLPNTPTTLSSIDHITLLQAQLAALALRKHNLLKVIGSLSSLFGGINAPIQMPPTSANDYANGYTAPLVPAPATPNLLVLDLAKRRETRGQVEKLERDLAEVRREEHELGLRLMRAQRRRDQEVPSALWVRRVTSVSDAS